MLKSPLKWVGGKSKLFNSISNHYPKEINNYHELFIGGGSSLFGLLYLKSILTIKGKIYAYDSNEVLIAYYKFLQTDYSSIYDTVMKIKNAAKAKIKKNTITKYEIVITIEKIQI